MFFNQPRREGHHRGEASQIERLEPDFRPGIIALDPAGRRVALGLVAAGQNDSRTVAGKLKRGMKPDSAMSPGHYHNADALQWHIGALPVQGAELIRPACGQPRPQNRLARPSNRHV